MTTFESHEAIDAHFRAKAEAIAGRPLEPEEWETGPSFGPHDNDFAGLPDASTLFLKSNLGVAITAEMDRRGLTQQAVATLVPGLTQSDVSQIRRGHFRGYSEGRLLDILAALGQEITISYAPTPDYSPGRILVMIPPLDDPQAAPPRKRRRRPSAR